MMFSMFLLWALVFIAVFLSRRWAIALAGVTIAWTIVLLTMRMTDPIPLNF